MRTHSRDVCSWRSTGNGMAATSRGGDGPPCPWRSTSPAIEAVGRRPRRGAPTGADFSTLALVGGKGAAFGGKAAVVALLALFAFGPPSVSAHHVTVAPELLTASVTDPCDPVDPPDPRPIQPDQVVIGEFGTELEGS